MKGGLRPTSRNGSPLSRGRAVLLRSKRSLTETRREPLGERIAFAVIERDSGLIIQIPHKTSRETVPCNQDEPCHHMMMVYHPPDAVIRFPGVTLARETFEALLALSVDRFEPSRTSIAHYAQISLPEGSSWDDLVGLIDRIGPIIQPYLERGEIARPRVEVALYFDDDKASGSLLIPYETTLTIGRWGFDLEVSAYLTSSD